MRLEYDEPILRLTEDKEGFTVTLEGSAWRAGLRANPIYVEKRDLDGRTVWVVTEKYLDQIEVLDSCTLRIEGNAAAMYGRLRYASVLDQGVLVQLYNDCGQRSIFLYGMDGKQKWQVDERDYLPNIGYQSVRQMESGNLYAQAEGGFAAIVDIHTGTIIEIVPSKDD